MLFTHFIIYPMHRICMYSSRRVHPIIMNVINSFERSYESNLDIATYAMHLAIKNTNKTHRCQITELLKLLKAGIKIFLFLLAVSAG